MKFMTIKTAALALLSSLSLGAAASVELTAQDIAYLAERAFRSSSPMLSRCSYTVRTEQVGLTAIAERFDPILDRDQPWSLLSVGGTHPTVEQLAEYKPRERMRHPAVVSFEFIDRNSLKFVDQSEDGVQLSFNTVASQEAEHLSELTNTVVIEPISAIVKEVRRKSESPFRVEKFAKVLEFEAIDRFGRHRETRSLVLASSTTRLKAQTALQSIDKTIHSEFNDIDCGAISGQVDQDSESEPKSSELQISLPTDDERDTLEETERTEPRSSPLPP